MPRQLELPQDMRPTADRDDAFDAMTGDEQVTALETFAGYCVQA
ncbi:hypothetical protein [Amycolatopsis sp. NPDC059657]